MAYRLATKAVKVTCPYCKKVRTPYFYVTKRAGFTGVCQHCKHIPNLERKKLEALAPKAPEPEPDVPTKKQYCLNDECGKEIPPNKYLRFCEACRARNARIG